MKLILIVFGIAAGLTVVWLFLWFLALKDRA